MNCLVVITRIIVKYLLISSYSFFQKLIFSLLSFFKSRYLTFVTWTLCIYYHFLPRDATRAWHML